MEPATLASDIVPDLAPQHHRQLPKKVYRQNQKPRPLRAGLSAIVLHVLICWDNEPLLPHLEQLLRVIWSKYYRDGVCWATQETLARAINVAKSTVQLYLRALACLGFIRVVPQGRGKPDLIYLAPGVDGALQTQTLERERERCGQVGYFASTIVSQEELDSLICLAEENRPKATPTTSSTQALSTKGKRQNKQRRVREAKVELACPVACLKEENTTEEEILLEQLTTVGVKQPGALLKRYGIARVQRHLDARQYLDASNPAGFLVAAIRADWSIPTRESVTQEIIELPQPVSAPCSELASEDNPQQHAQPAAAAVKPDFTPTLLSPLDQATPEPQSKKPIVPLAASSPSIPDRKNARARQSQLTELVEIGFVPAVAALTVKAFDHERIQRNIDLAEHVRANNPPGYLLRAIQEDYATSRGMAKPGSEHARVLANFTPKLPPSLALPDKKPQSLPLLPDPWIKKREMFAQIEAQEREHYLHLARITPTPQIIALEQRVEQAASPLMRDIQERLLASAIRSRAIELVGKALESAGWSSA